VVAESKSVNSPRVFKTAWFTRAARKSLIDDAELCAAMKQTTLGQADDLGGGVYKKRLGKNLYRSLIVSRGGRYWVYVYLFAKSNRENIGMDELASFRGPAKLYSQKSWTLGN
jgi:hypothetical protein